MFAAHEVVATAHAGGPALAVAVAAQGDSPTAAVAAQDDGLEAAVALPRKQKISKHWKRSLSMNQLVKAIVQDTIADPNVTSKGARSVLDSLAKIGIRELKSRGVFTVPDLANLKVQCVEAETGRKCIIRASRNGKTYYQRQRPGGKRVMAAPALKLKRSIDAGWKLKISRSIDAASPLAIEDGVCSGIGQ